VRLTAHQPNYLPWLGYFHKIALGDVFVILDSVQYAKNGWTNRNRIKTSQGTQWLTVPVKTAGRSQQSIRDVEIDNEKTPAWPRKHWQAICQSYRRADFFDRHADYFGRVYLQPWNGLSALNEEIIRYFLRQLAINVTIYRSSELAVVGSKESLLLNLCQILSCDTLVVGQGASREYVRPGAFEQCGIRIIRQEFEPPVYSQPYGEFVPGLSALDFLFNCGNCLPLLARPPQETSI
jgi:hypothetical protein